MRRARRRPPVFVVAHDMGTSVATELMARDLEGGLEMDLAGALLFNGSMVLDLASRPSAQKLLRSRFGPVFARLTTERTFGRSSRGSSRPEHPLSDEEARRPVVAALPRRRRTASPT